MTKRAIIVLAAVAVALAFSAAALASPRTDQYGNPVKNAQPPALQSPAGTSAQGGGGSLPFTGLDLALIVVGGCGAAGTGFVLRRAARGRRN